MARRLIVEIIGDSRSLERAYKRSEVASSKFGTNTKQFAAGTNASLAKSVVGFGLVTTGALVAGSAVRGAIDEFTQMQKVTAQTNAVLESTGGVANVTARHVADLSKEILRYSGIDDEAVQAGENLLLTFKNVRNEGAGTAAIFDRATKAAVDLSVAGFGSLDSTAKQLGKALNDPVRGMTALGRAGVTFTQAQKDQIKALVASGQQLEAQKLILTEVESQVGGSARAYGETLPGQIAKAQESLKNLGGQIVTEIAPAMTRWLDATNDVIGALDRLGGASDRFSGGGTGQIKGFLDKTIGEMPDVGKLLLGPAAFLFEPPTQPTFTLAKAWNAVGDAIKGAARNLDPFRQGFTDISKAFAVAAKKFGPKDATAAPKPFQLPGPIRLAQARAGLTKSLDDDIAVARMIVAKIGALVAGGKLKGERLISALGELKAAQDFIQSTQADAARKTKDAQVEAARKTAEAQKKHADAVKAAAEKQKQAAQEAARRIRDATDQARSEIGELFAGPVLNPTDAARKTQLGVPGPDPGKLLADIRAQTAQALRFERDLRRLRGLGVGKSTIEELRGQGTAAMPQIEAILGTRGVQRRSLIQALVGRERAAQRIGQMIVHTPKVHLHAKQVVLSGGGGVARTMSNPRSGRFAGQ